VIACALTIAGSDSSGGAGIQADLKTFTSLRVYGMSVITSLTAQNTTGVTGVLDAPPGFVAKQLDAVLQDIPADAAKTGMLSNAGIVEVVAAKVREYGVRKLVVDPVMISKSGSALLREDAVDAVRRALAPLALLVTPNLEEARVLSGCAVRTPEDMEEAALRIHELGAVTFL
jgi:hydroxymethylpyrimidine/phosphomethylpyrimidine kinase